MTAAMQGTGKMYVSPAFPTPGTIIGLQLNVIPASLSLSIAITGQKVVTAMTMGTYTATVAPAMNPQGVPDPLVVKVGQWTVETTSQSSFRSGVPVPIPAPQSGDGEGGGEGAEAKGDPHWVGVSVEDSDGNPLANQLLSALLPTGERIQRKLGDSGAARVDGIEIDGLDVEHQCVVSLIFDPSLVPIAPADDGYIAINVVDEAGEPLAGREVVLTLPDGTELRRTLDELGHTRFVGIARGAECSLEITPALVLLEFVLVDEDDEPLADKPYKVVDSTGEVYTGVLDAQGAASLEVYEGDCDVSIDFDAQSGNGDSEDGDSEADDGEESPSEDEAKFVTTLTLTDLRGGRLKNWPVSVKLANGEIKELSSDGDGLLTIKSNVEGELELSFAKNAGEKAEPRP
jgi:hypothetical protein